MTAEPDDHSLGRSHGGLTTKVHLACEQRQNRAVATRYDKLAVRYEATLHIAAIKRVAPTPLMNRP